MRAQQLFDANNLADELGQLRAEIKQLTDVAKGIESLIKAGGDGVTENSLFTATVTTCEVKSINWQKIARSFEPSNQRIAGNTSFKSRTTLKLTAHKKAS